MPEIAVECFQLRYFLLMFEQVLAHMDKSGRAARRLIEAADQFLSARLGRLMQGQSIQLRWIGAIGIDGL